MRPGAEYLGDRRCRFRVWAPLARRVDVRIGDRVLPLAPQDRGYFDATIEEVAPGATYVYILDGAVERPDPASKFQPEGVHRPSAVVDPSFAWTDDAWAGVRDLVFYELHVGTFTPEGTFDAAIADLDRLADLGITAVEVMPVAQFPGTRNWGYDGVYPYAVQNSYGGPAAFQRFVNACHARGLAVLLDVVYNHLGPEGNYLAEFGPYFTDEHRTAWGPALNYDGAGSDEVREYFIQNALYWTRDFHVDGLRLDAIHAILDLSAKPFLAELAERVRPARLVGESDRNDPFFVQPIGLDALWNDDFHHALHVALTGERTGYYQDFSGVKDLATAIASGFVYTGQYSAYRRRRHGAPPRGIDGTSLVVFAQNHDQVGNRANGERLSTLVSFEQLKLAAGVVALAPAIPFFFMGEEYGETAPFLYFTSHGDPTLIEAVRRGRLSEMGATIDEQAEATFRRCVLPFPRRDGEKPRTLARLHQTLLRLRREHAALAIPSLANLEVDAFETQKVLAVRRWQPGSETLALYHFGETAAQVLLPPREGAFVRKFDSASQQWLGGGSSVPERIHRGSEVTLTLSPHSFVLFVRDDGGIDEAAHLRTRALLPAAEGEPVD